MIDTSIINTLLLLSIIGLVGFVIWSVRKSAPATLTKLTTTYDNVCKNGIDVILPEGALINEKLPMIGTLKMPTSDLTVKIDVKCD